MNRYLLWLLAPLLLMAGCATTGEPRIVTREVLVPVPTPCPDRRGPAPTYPDTPEALRRQAGETPDQHLARVAPPLLAGRELRIGREAENEAQITGCAR
jgi:hypothetical protein